MDISPVDSEILIVKLGEEVRANRTFLAHLPGYKEKEAALQ